MSTEKCILSEELCQDELQEKIKIQFDLEVEFQGQFILYRKILYSSNDFYFSKTNRMEINKRVNWNNIAEVNYIK